MDTICKNEAASLRFLSFCYWLSWSVCFYLCWIKLTCFKLPHAEVHSKFTINLTNFHHQPQKSISLKAVSSRTSMSSSKQCSNGKKTMSRSRSCKVDNDVIMQQLSVWSMLLLETSSCYAVSQITILFISQKNVKSSSKQSGYYLFSYTQCLKKGFP